MQVQLHLPGSGATHISSFERARDWLLKPVDGSSLAIFRICFGVVLLAEMCWFLFSGSGREYFIEPEFLFTFFPLPRWPANWMYVHLSVVALSTVMIAFGLWYRAAATVFFLGFTYLFLVEKTHYLNHFYLVCLIAFLLILIPAHRCWSLDRWRSAQPLPPMVPNWSLMLLRAQIALIYFYGGIAKLNADWLVRREPQRFWMQQKADWPLFGPFLGEEWFVALITYGGVLVDLCLPFLLLGRRTFPFAVLIAVLFNASNAYLFDIGIFPFFMVATLGLFARPDWPRRALAWVRRRPAFVPVPANVQQLVPGRAAFNLLLVFLVVYSAAQVLVPLRHFLYPGSAHWTEEGHRFSWHMMLRQKEGLVLMFVQEPNSNQRLQIDLERRLTEKQRHKMAGRPDMILQYARHIAAEYEREHGIRPRVYVHAVASLNRRPYQFLIDPQVDLAAQKARLRPASWIVPLQ